MSYLYPHLLRPVAQARYDVVCVASPAHLRAGGAESPPVVYSPLGGVPAPEEHLAQLAAAIRALADEWSFPTVLTELDAARFDASLAILLHQRLSLAPSEAAHRGMWSYLALIAVPDVVRWRWIRSENAERWIGSDLTRHALARLWWQAETLVANSGGDYSLVGVLSESEANQIFERRSLAGDRRLAQAFVRRMASSPATGPTRRAVARNAALRALRLMAFVDSAALTDAELREFISASFVGD